MNDSLFTLTLIKDGEDSRILVISGETPAKDDDEAEAIIAKKSLASTYSAIEKAIPNFRESEDGCEDWVTHTLDEFLDIYDLDLVKVFEDAEEEEEAETEDSETEEVKETSDGSDGETSGEEISDKDSTGENTTEDEVESGEEASEEPEFDSDLFGKGEESMTEPGEIFFVTFKPEHLQSIKDSLNF